MPLDLNRVLVQTHPTDGATEPGAESASGTDGRLARDVPGGRVMPDPGARGVEGVSVGTAGRSVDGNRIRDDHLDADAPPIDGPRAGRGAALKRTVAEASQQNGEGSR